MHIEIRRDGPLPPLRRTRLTAVPVVSAVCLAVAGLGLWRDAPAAVPVAAAVVAMAGVSALAFEHRMRSLRPVRPVEPLPEAWTVTGESIAVHTAASRRRWNWALFQSATVHPDRYRLRLAGGADLDLPRPELPTADAEIAARLRAAGLLSPRSGDNYHPAGRS